MRGLLGRLTDTNDATHVGIADLLLVLRPQAPPTIQWAIYDLSADRALITERVSTSHPTAMRDATGALVMCLLTRRTPLDDVMRSLEKVRSDGH